MGGSSKKTTVGYKYYLGVHMILCYGPIDLVRRILVDDRKAWEGVSTGGRISVDKPELFGGGTREGGISGNIDFEQGASDQLPNDYLESITGYDLPGYRGVVGMVLRQCYLGNNPYLKKWAFRAQRVHTRQNGIAQWYDEKAPIGALTGNHAIYIALDTSDSMNDVVSGSTTRLDNAKTAINRLLDYLNQFVSYASIDIMIVGWDGSKSTMLRRSVDSSGIQLLKNFVDSLNTIVAKTDFELGVENAPDFFGGASSTARRTVLFLTDGEPYRDGTEGEEAVIAQDGADILFSVANVNAFAFNIDLTDITYTEYMDNTPQDGVPVLDGSDPDSLLDSLRGIISGQIDMNPAHIIRECLTDPDWGLGYQDADINDASFITAADGLYNESMGMSLMWSRESEIQDFISEVLRHIDGSLYVDRKTGTFHLKLVRDDYSESDLLVLDESCVTQITNASRPAIGELTNSVTVNFWDHTTGETSSVTAQDQALIQMQGAVVSTTLDYGGFTNQGLASRIALRDLKSLSSDLLSCDIEATRIAADLNIGEPFILDWPDLDIDSVIMRVQSIQFGDGRDNAVRITAVEDVFATPDTAIVSPPEDDLWVDPAANEPEPAQPRIFEELPYYELVVDQGQAAADALLAESPDAGFTLAAAGRQSNEINALLFTDSGAGYQEQDTLDFSPFGYIVDDIGPTDTAFSLIDHKDLDEVEEGSIASIGDELVRVDSVESTSSGYEITVGRGVLDTVPALHSGGSSPEAMVFWGDFFGSDEIEYAASESVEAKMLTATGGALLSSLDAPIDSVSMDSRAIRPYPPGDFRIDGLSYPAIYSPNGAVELTWTHRDRTQQTSGTVFDHTFGDIGPEANVTYRVEADAELTDGSMDESFISEDVGSVSSFIALDSSTPAPAGTVRVTFRIYAVRDGYDSWQPATWTIDLLVAPTQLIAQYKPFTAPTNLSAINT
ncbi:phage tail protein [Marinobacter sp. JSM 1782161]|uniref:phage tail protein n=1 Tax=Marinobacter sp. JSM 1782161 TaxID=2685906 RepID=UPI001403BD3E|nr:VWA domain-containing protein [Marinobacter sp. JSM 1782161]